MSLPRELAMATLLAFCLSPGCGPAARTREPLPALGARDVEIQDVYKAASQAFLGPGHAISDPGSAAAWLREEWRMLERPLPGEPLIELLHPEGSFVRLNLRPYKERGGEVDTVLVAFLRAGRAGADTNGFHRTWKAVREAIVAGGSRVTVQAYDSLDALLAPIGYPAIHHSKRYGAAMRPAYRVVTAVDAARFTSEPDGGPPD